MSIGLLEPNASHTAESDFVCECSDHGLSTLEPGEPEIIGLSDDGGIDVFGGCGLRRVRVLRDSGGYHVLRELMRPADAQRFANEYNATHDAQAESIDYVQAFHEARAVEALATRRGLM